MADNVSERPEFEWRKHPEHDLLECYPAGTIGKHWRTMPLAWIEPRPHYCDRGHWKVCCNLPDIDPADSFPRYYMRFDVAKEETERWLLWRMFKIRTPDTSAVRHVSR